MPATRASRSNPVGRLERLAKLPKQSVMLQPVSRSSTVEMSNRHCAHEFCYPIAESNERLQAAERLKLHRTSRLGVARALSFCSTNCGSRAPAQLAYEKQPYGQHRRICGSAIATTGLPELANDDTYPLNRPWTGTAASFS